MAIERKAKPYAFDDAEEVSTGMEDEMPSKPMETGPEESPAMAEDSETATLSMEMLGGQKVTPGDVVRLEVVNVSPDDGTIQVRYAKPNSGGIDKAAAAFNEGT